MIYLSCDPADQPWAESLFERLTAEGYDLTELLPADDMADTLIAVLTPASLSQKKVPGDVVHFFGKKKKIVLVIPPHAPIHPENWLATRLVAMGYVVLASEAAYLQLFEQLGPTAQQRYRTALKTASDKLSVEVPSAYLEVLESNHRRQIGQRFSITAPIMTLGKKGDIPIRGAAVKQCLIFYDPHDDHFYLETDHPRSITTLHDRVLQPDHPLPMWNGDLITLNEFVVLQFRRAYSTRT